MRKGPGKRTLEERLARKIEKHHASELVDDECWIWTGARTGGARGGYGHIKIGGDKMTPTLVYRLLYERENGPVPDGLKLDHVCDVKECVRPSHLEQVTHGENIRRAYQRRRDAEARRAA